MIKTGYEWLLIKGSGVGKTGRPSSKSLTLEEQEMDVEKYVTTFLKNTLKQEYRYNLISGK
ncbi:hypothetical protein LS684_20680 (plasmid) [Cytobacillus spongiae]|uniref:hypothetical protein n=1 Tax=Cytobacillus spongiae TaxID=2901381 RepID=UPI001F1BD451|nr:hypothetical protein [Cytobacillus spongiae]UII58048.1 hypothetical protein LS684_20680 [Cytobacillus spongiae]